MEETRNNCFGLKIRSTILRHTKTSKHECRNITAMYISAFVLTCFRLTKGRATYFRPETTVANFFHLMVFLFKVLFNHSWKHHFVVFHCHMYFGLLYSVLQNRTLAKMTSLLRKINWYYWRPKSKFFYINIVLCVALYCKYMSTPIMQACKHINTGELCRNFILVS